jgi:3-methyladenine DNA glycosylase Mpg
MEITRRHYGADVTRGRLTVRALQAAAPIEVLAAPRIGITHCAGWPLRFVIEGNRFVSRAAGNC